LEESSGLYYFRNRHYDPGTGRFLQRDPVWDSRNVGNQYSFGNSSPVSVSDPLGTKGFFNDMAEIGGLVADIGSATYDFAAETVSGAWDRATETYDMVRKSGYNPIAAGALALADVVLSETGAYDAYSAYEGYDTEVFIRTGEYKPLSDAERIGKLASGVFKLASTIVPGARALRGAARAARAGAYGTRYGARFAVNKTRCLIKKGPGGACFVAGTLVTLGTGDFTQIEDVYIGQRVAAQQDAVLQEPEIDPRAFLVADLLLPNPDGSDDEIRIRLLRHRAWLAERYDASTGLVSIRVEQMDLEGDAVLLGLSPCPEIAPGAGRLVTGTFVHDSSYVVSLRVETPKGLDVIRATRQHPFAVAGQGWTRADRIREGDTLCTLGGSASASRVILGQGQRERVFNLEVEGSHTYYVGGSRTLVHNYGDTPILKRKMQEALRRQRFMDPKTGRTGADVELAKVKGPTFRDAKKFREKFYNKPKKGQKTRPPLEKMEAIHQQYPNIPAVKLSKKHAESTAVDIQRIIRDRVARGGGQWGTNAGEAVIRYRDRGVTWVFQRTGKEAGRFKSVRVN
tara:strand:- start:1707 stop:3413 length:1707 start_codon:yes stop_codon:yes gene_type:complete